MAKKVRVGYMSGGAAILCPITQRIVGIEYAFPPSNFVNLVIVAVQGLRT